MSDVATDHDKNTNEVEGPKIVIGGEDQEVITNDITDKSKKVSLKERLHKLLGAKKTTYAVPALCAFAAAGIGLYFLFGSHAATPTYPPNGRIYISGEFSANPDASDQRDMNFSFNGLAITDTSNPQHLYTQTMARLPDSDDLIVAGFKNNKFTLYRSRADGYVTKELFINSTSDYFIQNKDVSASPDGTKLAVDSADPNQSSDKNAHLRLFNLKNNQYEKDFGVTGGEIGWLPDGNNIFIGQPSYDYGKGADACILNITTQAKNCFRINTATQAQSSTVSPDGRSILSIVKGSGDTNSIIISDINGKNIKVVREGSSNISNEYPAWSPDGKKIVFVTNDKSQAVNDRVTQMVMNIDGSNIVKLRNKGGNYLKAVWATAPTSRFNSLIPSRIVDTRPDTGSPYSGQVINPNSALEVQVTGVGGVPANDVQSVVVNITGAFASDPTYITAYPSGSPRPNTSTLNIQPREISNEQTIVKVGGNGKVKFYNFAGQAHITVDVLGYYSKTGSYFTSTNPARLVDTRQGSGNRYAGIQPAPGGGAMDIPVAGEFGIPSNATAVVVNVLAANEQTAGFLTIFPNRDGRPNTSSLNFSPNQVVSKEVVSKLDYAGRIGIYNGSGGSMNVIVDVLGYYTGNAATEESYVSLTPTRMVDTRDNNVYAYSGQHLGTNSTLNIKAINKAGIPEGATSVVVNLTALNISAADYMTVYPNGTERPGTSNINPNPGKVTFNEVTAKLGADGSFNIYNFNGSADVIIDVVGYFYPPVNSFANGFTAPPSPVPVACDSTWRKVPGTTQAVGTPTVVYVSNDANSEARDSVVVAVRGSDNGVYYQTLSLSQQQWDASWTSLNGKTSSSPYLDTQPDPSGGTLLRIRVIGTDSATYTKQNTFNGWSDWVKSTGNILPGRITQVTVGGLEYAARINSDKTISYRCGNTPTPARVTLNVEGLPDGTPVNINAKIGFGDCTNSFNVLAGKAKDCLGGKNTNGDYNPIQGGSTNGVPSGIEVTFPGRVTAGGKSYIACSVVQGTFNSAVPPSNYFAPATQGCELGPWSEQVFLSDLPNDDRVTGVSIRYFPDCTTQEFAQGASGDCVGYIQRAYNGFGEYWHYDGWSRIPVTSSFDAATVAQTKAFQQFGGAITSENGAVKTGTWGIICGDAVAVIENRLGGFPAMYDSVYAARSAGCNLSLGRPKCTTLTIKEGSTEWPAGPCTIDIEHMIDLNVDKSSLTPGFEIDGVFDAATTSEVKKWQAKSSLPSDGIVNAATWKSLCTPSGGLPYKDPAQGQYYYDAGCDGTFAHY